MRQFFGQDDKPASRWLNAFTLPFLVMAALVFVWAALAWSHWYPASLFPAPLAVARGLREEVLSGRLGRDLAASLFRVGAGFLLAVVMGVPLGVCLGRRPKARAALLPFVNFFRNLSPLAWIPFAILWLGIGDAPVIFLIFLASLFPVALATLAAVGSVPEVYYNVAHDYGFTRWQRLTQVTLPAIAPQALTGLRVTVGLAWVVVVGAEMIAGRDGLGFAVWDARNGLRSDLLVVNMIVIGVIGVALDWLLRRAARAPSVSWGYGE